MNYYVALAGASFLGTSIRTPVYSSGGVIYPLTTLNESQVKGFVGFYHHGGEKVGDATYLYPQESDSDEIPAAVGSNYTAGVDYYLGTTGPAELSALIDGNWSRCIGKGQPNGRIKPLLGEVFVVGSEDLPGLVTTKGDLLVATGAGAMARGAVPEESIVIRVTGGNTAGLPISAQSLPLRSAVSIANTTISEKSLVGRPTGGNLGEVTGTQMEDWTRESIAAATASIAVNSQKITGIASGSASGEAVEYSQLGEAVDGAVGIVELDYTGQPADTEAFTVTTAGPVVNVYEWDDGLGGGVTPGNVSVAIGIDADASYANLAASIAGMAQNIVADVPVAGRFRIRTADAPGGAAANSGDSVAIVHTTSNLTAIGTNTNQSGRATAARRIGVVSRAVDALFAAGASGRVGELTWTPTRILSVQVLDTNGGPKYVTDRFTVSGNAVVWTSNGATNIANTDVIRVVVEE